MVSLSVLWPPQQHFDITSLVTQSFPTGNLWRRAEENSTSLCCPLTGFIVSSRYFTAYRYLLWAGGISGCFQWDFSRYFILHSGGKESAGDWSLSYLPIPISSNNFQWTCMVVINIIFSSPLGILFKSPVCFFPIVVWDMLRMNYSLFWPIFSFNYFSFASALPKILLLWMWCRNVLLLQKSLCMLTISNRKTCRCRI